MLAPKSLTWFTILFYTCNKKKNRLIPISFQYQRHCHFGTMKKGSTCFTVRFQDEQNTDQESMQKAFKKFRQMHQKRLKKLKQMKVNVQRRLQDPDRRWELRMKFLQQAKSYIGVPYHKRYHQPGSPEYESPLFLDCCGLVRKVLLDLKEDFGFVIGPGNQAYQYDTLPITLATEADMKPGDLVFISGSYFNPQSNVPMPVMDSYQMGTRCFSRNEAHC
ncbi:uncharacterized protein LOC121329145 [Polyodon spathula]|uniref:uncharacterized protein LOC121329145 n=1 Tax=Polyodon spathula TaxID=7913 RepID=UPI001B7F5C06|nr:uncharacterized protein LOC121329145 [Polyodon spathula]